MHVPDSPVEPRNLGLLSSQGYTERRSATLVADPEAILNDRQEADAYLAELETTYHEELDKLDRDQSFAMSPNCRLAIAIPAYNEGRHMQKTLGLLGPHQMDRADLPVDSDLYEIHILHSHPLGTEQDYTQREVEEFKQAHPEIRVVYVYQESDEHSTMGSTNKYLSDFALVRSAKRDEQSRELILVRGNADVEDIDPHFIVDMIDAFDSNPKMDALTAMSRLPDWALQKPNVRVATTLWYLMDRLVETGAIGRPQDRQKEPAGIVGTNSAIRSSIYAAVGGYNPSAKHFEDTEMGWMISDARAWDPERIAFLNRAKVVEDPRRPLEAVAARTPVTEMYADFYSNTGVRDLDSRQLLALIPDDLDFAQLEREADAYWQSRDKGAYKFLGPKFAPIFDRAMGLLGVEYNIIDGHIKVTNVDRLLSGLSTALQREVRVVPTDQAVEGQPQPFPARLDAYYAGISNGLLEARAVMAEKCAARIRAVEQGQELEAGDQDKVENLKREYKRFANVAYASHDDSSHSDMEAT